MRVPDPMLSVADFWDLVKMQPTGRYEYIRGAVRSLHILNPAALNHHERLVIRLASLFETQFSARKSPCGIFGSNTYFYLSEKEGEEEYLLPDLSVSCDKGDLEREKGITRPSVVVEVLSKGTAQDDRTWKKDEYLACPSIQSYLIVDQTQPHVTVYQRQSSGYFQETVYRDHDLFTLTHLDITINVDDMYSRIL